MHLQTAGGYRLPRLRADALLHQHGARRHGPCLVLQSGGNVSLYRRVTTDPVPRISALANATRFARDPLAAPGELDTVAAGGGLCDEEAK